jgi:hypothetical protein
MKGRASGFERAATLVLAFAAALAPACVAGAAGSAITIGPYLQNPAPNAMTMPCHDLWTGAIDKAGFDLCIVGHVHTPYLLIPMDGRVYSTPADGANCLGEAK